MTSQAPGQAARTRVSGFAYDAATGLLTREVVEPGAGDVSGCVSAAAATGITLVTEHAHDRYGNRTGTTVRGPGIAARTMAASWGERAADGTVTANGRFAVGATNALGHAEQRWHDPAFGKVTRLRGPNRLETAWEHDGFGRAVRETRADGTETATERLTCSAAGIACPAIDSLSSAGARIAAAAVVGGTASKLGGGKFANGAAAGAFGRLFSEPEGPTAKQGEGGTAFVGGFFDYWTKGDVWRAYYVHIKAGHAGAYFTWDQSTDLAGWIEKYGPDVVVIGHSWGADTAAHVVASGHTVNELRTVDPVGWARPDFAAVARHARSWINYNATGGRGTWPNFVAGIGGAWNNAPSAAPGIVHRPVALDHATVCFVFCRTETR